MNRRQVLAAIGTGTLSLLGLGAGGMTEQVSHGYRDWDRATGISDVMVVNESGLSIPGSQDFGPFFVAEIPYLYVNCTPIQRARITLSWFADEFQTQSLGTDVLVTPQGAPVVQSVPVRGAFVLVSVEVSVNPSAINLRIFKTSTPFAQSAGLQGSANIVSLTFATIVPGTTDFDAVATRGGWMHWDGVMNVASWRFEVHALGFTGAASQLGYVDSAGFGKTGIFLAPAQPLRLRCVNNTAGNAIAWAHIAHHPFYP